MDPAKSWTYPSPSLITMQNLFALCLPYGRMLGTLLEPRSMGGPPDIGLFPT